MYYGQSELHRLDVTRNENKDVNAVVSLMLLLSLSVLSVLTNSLKFVSEKMKHFSEWLIWKIKSENGSWFLNAGK